MPSGFDFDHSPFDCLTAEERERVRSQVDIAYFREGEAILEAGMAPTHLFVVIKGFVRQFAPGDSEPVASFGPHDTFDGRSLVAGQVSGRFVAAEEVLAYQLAREAVNELIARNATFGALLFSDLSNKLAAIAGRRGEHELQSLALARVDAIPIRAPRFVDADRDVLSVVRLLQAERSTNVLVRDLSGPTPRLGIFTVTALQRAVLHGTPLDRLPVREVSSFGLITVAATDPVGDALTVMVRHKVHRVVVVAGDGGADILGVLEALDLFSFLSNHSYLINREIAEAQDLEALARASHHVTQLVGLLHGGGTRVGQIAALVQALNAQLFQRAWELIAPPELVANSCLFVMGSEGRGEQLQKTDQDNGLLLRDGYAPPADLDALCARLTRALIDFGWPECPGGIMVSNPQWRGSQAEFAERACQWLLQADGEQLMALAIFLDAHAVCGDAALLAGVRARLFSLATDNDAMLARFAAAIDAFAEDPRWWQRLLSLGEQSGQRFDIKKQGLFPIVHGVRSLALRAGLGASSTAARLEALAADGHIERGLATDVLESLYFFMGLRLKAGLEEQEAGHEVTGQVDPARMSSLERDLLKDTLEVVKRLRRMLRTSFRLDAL
ncbi:putative nucleotidyltransferase substrate binding domain-containing protein [Variovorax saccharolyticus]|uniref:putative nucleotidyltransferase substrate binding domain-containing protein n=1 Tax=Variovorax saccharolyticus TaxID=3053516 RepID=UPI0025787C0D|nr:putative nucleotidyltransferase substrate binding domain-containing protein [Variovorax sp. J31P216]MDM0027609.1 putative nucleotidyltransferase substrate binding domain-containing protein [Variovorax sp. J31P216]